VEKAVTGRAFTERVATVFQEEKKENERSRLGEKKGKVGRIPLRKKKKKGGDANQRKRGAVFEKMRPRKRGEE